jgi:urease accessory protein
MTTAHSIRKGPTLPGALTVTLDYDERLIRRKRLVSDQGEAVVVDLAEMVSLDHLDALVLADGRLVTVLAAPEVLYDVRGPLTRLAWHIGNRHTPCQIEGDRLLIRADPVLKLMLQGLGATVVEVTEPFRPEGGAYGHGRTFGHEH